MGKQDDSASDYWLQEILGQLENLVELNRRMLEKLDDIDAGIMLANNSRP